MHSVGRTADEQSTTRTRFGEERNLHVLAIGGLARTAAASSMRTWACPSRMAISSKGFVLANIFIVLSLLHDAVGSSRLAIVVVGHVRTEPGYVFGRRASGGGGGAGRGRQLGRAYVID